MTCHLQEEFDDEDDWNPCKAGGVCLMLLAQCTEHHIVPHVLTFIKENIKNPDWKRRDAAVMTLGGFTLFGFEAGRGKCNQTQVQRSKGNRKLPLKPWA